MAVLSPGELLGPWARSGLVRIVRTGIEKAGDETYSFLRRGGESKTSDPKDGISRRDLSSSTPEQSIEAS